jgi:hypothetical protein
MFLRRQFPVVLLFFFRESARAFPNEVLQDHARGPQSDNRGAGIFPGEYLIGSPGLLVTGKRKFLSGGQMLGLGLRDFCDQDFFGCHDISSTKRTRSLFKDTLFYRPFQATSKSGIALLSRISRFEQLTRGIRIALAISIPLCDYLRPCREYTKDGRRSRTDMPEVETAPNPVAKSSAQPLRHRRALRLALILAGIGASAGLLFETGRVLLGPNFHVVVPGLVFRGAQPGPAELAELANRYHIRTIVNLRGSTDPVDWYLDELRTTAKFDMSQEDLCFSAGRLPSTSELKRLVEVFDHAEYPIFLHCRRGADRTGLASAIYMLLKTPASCREARHQLGLRFGHVALGRTANLDCFLDFYEEWLRERQFEHTPQRFRRWLLEDYRNGGLSYRIEKFVCETGPLRAGQPCRFRAMIRNIGQQTWHFRPGTTAGTKLGFILRNSEGKVARTGFSGYRDADVHPGETIDLVVVIAQIGGTDRDALQREMSEGSQALKGKVGHLPASGRYRLLVDLVDPNQGWFFQMGSEPLEQELMIRE